MKKHIIALAIFAMAGLLAAAFAWDSVRMAAEGRRRVCIADKEIEKHERRFVILLAALPQLSPEVQAAIGMHQQAADRQTRNAAYETLIASFRQTLASEIDPTNPLNRKFMDDIAGAINRREFAEKQFDAEVAAYQHSLNGFRGDVARMLSSKAQADWKSSD